MREASQERRLLTRLRRTICARHTSPEERWVVALLLFCGALPWVGYFTLGAWDDRELGIATLVLAFTLRGLLRDPRPTGTPRAHHSDNADNLNVAFGREERSRPFERTEWTSHI